METTDSRLMNLRKEGVGCESCHGNASKWTESHTAWDVGKRIEQMKNVHMPNLNDMTIRAATCAGCHVGDGNQDGLPVRDMNHDMIAAGHPRLDKFNFEVLQKELPQHWFERDRGSAKREANGNAALQDALKRLASDREKRRNQPRSPWPEFADQKCADCHRTIGVRE